MTLGPLSYLAKFRQFLPVMLVPLTNGRTNKLPVHWQTGQVCDAHDPAVWTDYATAAAVAARCGSMFGVGFVLTDADDLFCVDLDNCAQPGGTWSEFALSIRASLPGTVVEISQSGRGLHLWGRRSAMPAHASKNIALHAECYSSKRFILIGSHAVGEMAEDCTAIDEVIAAFFPPREKVAVNNGDEDSPRADWRGPSDDADLLRRALQSKSAASTFGSKASFADLWAADQRALGKAYPPDAGSSEPFDRSSADAALCAHLAFWTGCHQTRMARLMRASGLARSKYDDREDYLPRTIANACSMQREVLQDKPSAVEQALTPTPVAAAASLATMRGVEGNTYLPPSEQAKLFAGCTYVLDAHRVLVPGGHLLKPEQFRAKFGGYTFVMDDRNEKTSRNAWEAFTESQVLRCPQADGTLFDPTKPFGTLVTDAGRVRVNTYWPVDVPCKQGDVTPFLNHLAKLLPDPRDRLICLSAAAAIVQYPGVKLQWAVLLQGVEGNGKTLISRCIAEAVGRRYVYWPKASKIAKQFNAWLFGHIFFAVEDIHTSENVDVIEELKPMITGGDGIEIEGKGIDQVSREICGNFWFNSNHKNALRKTRNDRRFCILYCAQQTVEDLARDGMGDAYMTGLYDWLKGGGYAAVTYLLKNFPIPDEFNPATKCQRAPTTSSTNEAIEQSLGAAEQEVAEAIEQGNAGFAGGWVSSIALDRLLDRIGKGRSVPLNRRREMMRALGYDWHPSLPGGRVNNSLLPDGGKPRLYVRAGHPALALTGAGDIARAYTAAQPSA
jgi:hypothetical protein